MSKNTKGQIICDDCAGFDLEWMRHCNKHGTDRCRGCTCQFCEEDAWDAYEEDGPLDLEDQLENALQCDDILP